MNAVSMKELPDLIDRLGEIGDWVSDKEWHQNPIAAQAQKAIQSLRANHESVVETKRASNARLKAALEGLQAIYTLCVARPENADPEAMLKVIYQISGDAFEQATSSVSRPHQGGE